VTEIMNGTQHVYLLNYNMPITISALIVCMWHFKCQIHVAISSVGTRGGEIFSHGLSACVIFLFLVLLFFLGQKRLLPREIPEHWGSIVAAEQGCSEGQTDRVGHRSK
jgi:hypothetical protein